MTDCVDVTEEYGNQTTSNGKMIFEVGYDASTHSAEIETASWLIKTFGGTIFLLTEKTRQGEETPDYRWNEKLWERKGIATSNENSIDKRIRKAYSQINENRGGIVVDFSGSKLTHEQAVRVTLKSAVKRARGVADIMILKDEQYKVYRIKK